MHPIVIPTWKRVDNQRTWNQLHPDLRQHVVFVVRPEEADKFGKYAPSTIDVLPPEVQNLAMTRQYIWDKYSKLHDRFYQLDDDVLGLFSVSFDENMRWSSVRLTDLQGQRALFAAMETELDSGVGICSPRPNWTIADTRSHRFPRHSGAFITGFYAFDSKRLRDLNLRFDRGVSTGDIDFIYQVLSRGIDCTYVTSWKYDIDLMQPVSDVHKNEIEEYRAFLDMWPGYVKRRTKERHHYGNSEEGRGSLMYFRTKLWRHGMIPGKVEATMDQVRKAAPHQPTKQMKHTLSYLCDEDILPLLEKHAARDTRYIYCLFINGQAFYVGDSDDVRARASSHTHDVTHPDRGATEGVKFMRERLKHGDVHFTVSILETVPVLDGEDGSRPTKASRAAEQRCIDMLKAEGHPITNRDPKEAKPRSAAPKARKVLSSIPSGNPGGWGVNYDDYGKGLTVRTKSPIDGVYWVANHDDLVDKINESLLSKGLVPIGPNKKRYGASIGVRPGVFKPEA
jgi:hypothetical protein